MSSAHALHPRPMTEELWGLEWRTHLPWTLGDVVVEASRFDVAFPFVRTHFAHIFEQDRRTSPFLADRMTPAKARFFGRADVFLFREGDEVVGVLIGHPTDWSTYYMRTAAFLPSHQHLGLLTECVERTLGPLASAGVERVEVECAPNNIASVRVLTKLGFHPTATSNTDRWGALLRFTRFLRPEAEGVFLDQFCSGVRYERRAPVSHSTSERRPS